MTPASSDLDLVLEAITYIQKLQNKLVNMSSEVTNKQSEINKETVNERLV